MQSNLFLWALAQLVFTTAVQATARTTACKADNCARAVTGTRFPSSIQSDRKADCSSFLRTTVTPATRTITVTVRVTPVPLEKRANGQLVERQVTVVPSRVPAYASPCSGTSRYSSACSCAGITRSTITVATPTRTVTVTTVLPRTCPAGKEPCGGLCKDLDTDPKNCGECGNMCSSGICQNGLCSNPSCEGSFCDNLKECGGFNCGCFATSSGAGFCGPGTNCAPLPDCTTNADCDSGTVCAVGTCCGRNVCLGAQGCPASGGASKLLFGRAASGNWTNGNPAYF